MRTIIAGTRNFNDYEFLKFAIKKSGFEITQIISGGATGADALGERYAKENNIPLVIFKADWFKWGKAAGPKRNRQMAENADALIAIWDGESRGTSDMIKVAVEKDLYIHVERFK